MITIVFSGKDDHKIEYFYERLAKQIAETIKNGNAGGKSISYVQLLRDKPIV